MVTSPPSLLLLLATSARWLWRSSPFPVPLHQLFLQGPGPLESPLFPDRELPPSCKCENAMAGLLCAWGYGRGAGRGRGNGESVNAFSVCTSVQSMLSTYETCLVGAVRVETSE